jgi:hypothetical protein
LAVFIALFYKIKKYRENKQKQKQKNKEHSSLINNNQSDKKPDFTAQEEKNAIKYAKGMATIMLHALDSAGMFNKNFNKNSVIYKARYLGNFNVKITLIDHPLFVERDIMSSIQFLLGGGGEKAYIDYLLIAEDASGQEYVFPIPSISLGEKEKNARTFFRLWDVYLPGFKRITLINTKIKTSQGDYYLSKLPSNKNDIVNYSSVNIIHFLEPYRNLLTDKVEKENARLKSLENINTDPFPIKLTSVILSSLRQIKAITNQDGKVSITQVEAGYLRFSLGNSSKKDNDTFLSALSQLLEPIRQPRYIIALVAKPKADDILSVPHVLGAKKEYAEIFLKTWRQYFSEYKKVSLLSAQSEQGQQYLLSVKITDYKAPKAINLRRIDRWQ